MHFRSLLLSIATATGLALAASATLQAAGDHEGSHGFKFGQPAEGADPDRIIEIDATDMMNFNPNDIQVEPGELVRFVVTNTGTLHHSFTIGTPEWHKDHEEQMQSVAPEDMMSHMQHEPNGVVVPPGETRDLTWKFSEHSEVRIGCHIPGHFPAGMKGVIDVG